MASILALLSAFWASRQDPPGKKDVRRNTLATLDPCAQVTRTSTVVVLSTVSATNTFIVWCGLHPSGYCLYSTNGSVRECTFGPPLSRSQCHSIGVVCLRGCAFVFTIGFTSLKPPLFLCVFLFLLHIHTHFSSIAEVLRSSSSNAVYNLLDNPLYGSSCIPHNLGGQAILALPFNLPAQSKPGTLRFPRNNSS